MTTHKRGYGCRFYFLGRLTGKREAPKIRPVMTSDIRIGSIVVAKVSAATHFAGEIGVCYGVGTFEGYPLYGFIFETGRFAVFAAEGLTHALTLTGRLSDATVGYEYVNDTQLKADFRAGRFATAFPLLKL
jgi:hypothetical protein